MPLETLQGGSWTCALQQRCDVMMNMEPPQSRVAFQAALDFVLWVCGVRAHVTAEVVVLRRCALGTWQVDER